MFQRPNKSFFQDPKELNDLIKTGNLIQKFLPKQTDIDKIDKSTHLPVDIKKIQARYLTSSHFKDIYLHLSQNKLSLLKQQLER